MLTMTTFEANLMRLGWVGDRMAIMYKEYPNIDSDTIEYNYKSLATEYIISQLWNFIKIRESLLNDLKSLNKEKIDQCLTDLWSPIFDNKIAIKKIRHNYVSHLQEVEKPFNPFIETIITDTEFPNNAGDILLFTWCVWSYKEFIKKIFKNEWSRAEKKFKVLKPITTQHGKLKQQDIPPIVNQRKQQVLRNLKKNGFI